MITAKDFDRLVYRRPNFKYKHTRISNVLGLDTEAYTTGRPFMICVSDGTFIDPPEALETLVKKYLRTNFLLYNMKYDSGAILYGLPRPVLYHLWKYGKTEYKDMQLSYIPHKHLKIMVEKNKVKETIHFWDVAQFYKGMSLQKASEVYLKDTKIQIETKRFTLAYVKKNFDEIMCYCVQDAELTRRLGEYFFTRLDGFDLTPSRIYSPASISFQYYTKECKYISAWRLYNRKIDALKYACDAYRGGKFEICARGVFSGHEYDITSAYPYFVSRLVDIDNARVEYSKRYHPAAVYGFLRVGFKADGKPYPCGIPYHNTQTIVYPSGTIYTTITKVEYEWLITHGFDVKIYGAWWFHVRSKRYPYRDTTLYLYNIKDKYKGKDSCMYSVIKVILNGIYGKMAQCTEQIDPATDKKYVSAGTGWNPVYASYITAQTRIMVTDLQYRYGNDCLAVHTDSVMLRIRDDSIIREGLGGFEYVTGGKGVLVASGMYQIGDHERYKGFRPVNRPDGSRDNWFKILDRAGNDSTIEYPFVKVESWCEAMAKNHRKSRINLFYPDKKIVDLNCDVKRAWPAKTSGKRLLSSLQYAPPIHVNMKKPAHWN